MYQKPVLDKDKFADYSELVKQLLSTEDAKAILALECDKIDKPPKITKTEIIFNGKGDDGHETFLFRRDDKPSEPLMHPSPENLKGLSCFNFCKTAQKPYDKYVVACCILAKVIFDKDVRFSSDGDIENLQEGKELAEKVLQSKVTIKPYDNGFEIEHEYRKATSEAEFIKDISK